jgi:hypothetical protein
VKPQTLQSMCPGIEPTGDSLVFLAQSDHDRETKYRVDKTAWHGHGACTCEDFQMRLQPFLKEGKTATARYCCKHISRVDRFMSIIVAQSKIRESEGKYNPEIPAF